MVDHDKPLLKRELGLTSLIIYYFSTIVGVGIFIVPLMVAKIAGPASIIAWVIALLCAYPFAVIFSHISQKYQVSGSIQRFLEDSWSLKFGKSMTLFLITSALFGNALLGYSAAKYFNELLGTNYDIYWLGCALLAIPILFNLLQIGLSSKIQTITLVLLITLIEVVIISSLPYYNMANLQPFAPNGFGVILPAIAVCFYSIVGWENVDAMAEEVQNPAQVYRKAAKIAIILIAFFYMSIALTIIFTLDHASLLNSTTILSAILNVSMGITATKLGGFIAIVLLILGANAWVFGTSRLIFALARDGILPAALAKISANNIPYTAVMVQILPYAVISLGFSIFDFNENFVVDVTSLNYLMLYTIIFLSGAKSFTTLNFKLLSVIAMLITATLLLQASPEAMMISVGLLALCFAYVYWLRRVPPARA